MSDIRDSKNWGFNTKQVQQDREHCGSSYWRKMRAIHRRFHTQSKICSMVKLVLIIFEHLELTNDVLKQESQHLKVDRQR